MPTEPQLSSLGIVLVGRFNPSIFHPQWFARMELIPVEEADSADTVQMVPQVCQFHADWFDCVVTFDKFQIVTPRVEMEDFLLDLVMGVFDALPHTPIWQFGVNREAHFEIASEERWHALGHRLSPKAFWGDTLLKPGTRAVAVTGERPPGGPKGVTTVTVQPSLSIHPGVFVGINDHFELRDDVPFSFQEIVQAASSGSKPKEWEEGAVPAMTALEEEWRSALERATTIQATVVSGI